MRAPEKDVPSPAVFLISGFDDFFPQESEQSFDPSSPFILESPLPGFLKRRNSLIEKAFSKTFISTF